MNLTYTGRRKVDVAKQREGGKFPPGEAETVATVAFPQFQGQQSQDYSRDDHKYDRANVGGGTGDDIPPTAQLAEKERSS